MPIAARVHKKWEEKLGAPVELAVIARRPGAGLAWPIGVGLWGLVVVTFLIFMIPTRGLIAVPLVALFLVRRNRNRRARVPTSIALARTMLAVVTSAELILGTDLGGRGNLGAVRVRIPRAEILSVEQLDKSGVVKVVRTNGETLAFSVVPKRDLAVLLRALDDASTRFRATGPMIKWGEPPVPA